MPSSSSAPLVEQIDPHGKGVGAAPAATALGGVAALGWNLLREDVSLPAAVLYQPIVAHNLAWMRRFVSAYDVSLAPHGKTTMCPRIFEWQIDAGAWGITLATASQMRAAAHSGVRRVLMANQLVGRRNMEIVADLLRDGGASGDAGNAGGAPFEAYVLVDSAENVEQLGRFFRERGQTIAVLIELGAEGGRTGVRTPEAGAEVVLAIERWRDAVTLAGVEVYEGVLPDEASIRSLLRRAVLALQRIAQDGHFAADRPVILSGAGSAWFDVVAEELVQAKGTIAQPVQVLLRPGCYVTHDVGTYTQAQARMEAANATVRGLGEGLRPAMHVWAYVQSRPEPTLAILGIGKRDAAFDAGMPVAALHHRPGGAPDARPVAPPKDWVVARMMDQHAYMTVPADADLRIGDMIAFDVLHPCLTWDKWKQVVVVDDDYRVVDLLQTYF